MKIILISLCIFMFVKNFLLCIVNKLVFNDQFAINSIANIEVSIYFVVSTPFCLVLLSA